MLTSLVNAFKREQIVFGQSGLRKKTPYQEVDLPGEDNFRSWA